MPKKKLLFKELINLSFRTFRTKPQRAFLTIMGMSVGIATVLLLVSLGYGLQYILIGKLITTEDSLVTMEVSYPTESNLVIENYLIDDLRKYESVSEISPIAEFPGEVSSESGSGLLTDIRIVEPAYFRLSGLLPSLGHVPKEDERGIVTSNQTIAPLGFSADETALDKTLNIKVFYQDKNGDTSKEVFSESPIPIKGVIVDDSLQPTVIIFDNSLPEAVPFYRKLLIKAKNVDVIESLRDQLINEGFLVSARLDLVTQARKFTNIVTIILGVFGITALIVSAIGMFNTMLVGFLERIYEVGILKSLGATDSDVQSLFLVESAIMGFMGGAGGVIMGIGLGKLFNFFLSVLATKYGGQAITLFVAPPWFVGLIMIFSIIIGVLSGWWPARRAAGLSPKEAFTKR